MSTLSLFAPIEVPSRTTLLAIVAGLIVALVIGALPCSWPMRAPS